MMDETCKDCAFFNAVHYECQIYPPRVSTDGLTYWPKVEADDWCGQFMSAENLYQKKEKSG